MWKKDQMGEEDQCVFSGAVCFLQNQICGKPAGPTSCLMAESGFRLVELGSMHPSSPPHSKEEGLSTKSHASPVSSDWLEMDPTKLAIVSSVTFLLQGPFSFDFCRSHTF